MFEKDAKEYQIRKHHQRLYGHKPVVMKELNTTFKDAAIFGYNKAKIELEESYKETFCNLEMNLKSVTDRLEDYEKANEWHYVKDEFPPENVPLNIITFDKNKKRRLWEGEYKGGNGEYWSGYFNHFIDVPYAWKEIVLPELKESE